ncbi:MAG: hypothetical protein LC799_20930, partial [Actinobacteria bacterium]|nr:hypothetical protein [Actinomycetota bacterium]
VQVHADDLVPHRGAYADRLRLQLAQLFGRIAQRSVLRGVQPWPIFGRDPIECLVNPLDVFL